MREEEAFGGGAGVGFLRGEHRTEKRDHLERDDDEDDEPDAEARQ